MVNKWVLVVIFASHYAYQIFSFLRPINWSAALYTRQKIFTGDIGNHSCSTGATLSHRWWVQIKKKFDHTIKIFCIYILFQCSIYFLLLTSNSSFDMQAANDPIAPARGIPRAEIKVSYFLLLSLYSSILFNYYSHMYAATFIYAENKIYFFLRIPYSIRTRLSQGAV